MVPGARVGVSGTLAPCRQVGGGGGVRWTAQYGGDSTELGVRVIRSQRQLSLAIGDWGGGDGPTTGGQLRGRTLRKHVTCHRVGHDPFKINQREIKKPQ
jgi:hypothetical protein